MRSVKINQISKFILDEFGAELKRQYLKRNGLEKANNNDYEKITEGLISVYGKRILFNNYKKLH